MPVGFDQYYISKSPRSGYKHQRPLFQVHYGCMLWQKEINFLYAITRLIWSGLAKSSLTVSLCCLVNHFVGFLFRHTHISHTHISKRFNMQINFPVNGLNVYSLIYDSENVSYGL